MILTAAAVNFALSIIALTKGQNRLNVSFAVLSFLLGLWNIFIVLLDGYGIEVFGRINFINITLIPLAGMYFAAVVYREKNGPLVKMFYAMFVPAAAMLVYGVGSFFYEPFFLWYDSKWCKIMIFAYMFGMLLLVVGSLISNFGSIRYKQEKIRIRYVIIAFLFVFAGGMLDLASGAGFFHFPVRYAGNICNVIYAGILFTAIFRARLFNLDLFLKRLTAYLLMAVIAGSIYTADAVLLSGNRTAMIFGIFALTGIFIYFNRLLQDAAFNLVDNIGGRSGVERAREASKAIIAGQEDEDLKIQDTLLLFERHIDLTAAVFVRGGDYYMSAWESAGSPFKKLIEGSAMPLVVIIRYETENKKELELLDRFGADIIMPLCYGGSIIGVMAAKKISHDISFTQDEVDLIRDMAASVTVFMKAKLMQKQQVEDENMKRLGMMAGQMAHEIKNPLAALWGAAQLIQGKSDADRENLLIINDEMKRLTNILDSWRDFSREMKVEKMPEDAEQLIAEAVKLVNLQEHRAEIRFEKPAEKIKVNVDREKMKQVFLNVILNAIDAAAFRDKPVVDIEVIRKRKYADIKIRDNGSGIKKENLAKVKEPMYTTKSKGSGLGLAVSERIMKAHGGAILLDSDGETFTEVTLSIPLE